MGEADDASMFERIRTDPQAWRAQAIQLRLSADVIYVEWEKISRPVRTLPSPMEKMLAYSQSFMLLTAFSFENLLKGVLCGRDPDRDLSSKTAGHAIKKMAIEVLTPALYEPPIPLELDLLERLEVYLVWAGRYQLPRREDVFANSTVQIRSNDPILIESLFAKIDNALQEEWQKRGNF